MNKAIYNKIQNGIEEGEKHKTLGLKLFPAAYRFIAFGCCNICLALDGCWFSVGNPDVLKLADFLHDDCRSTIGFLDDYDIKRDGGIEKVKEGDDKLHRLLTCSPYKTVPYNDKEYDDDTPCKVILQDLIDINRKHSEILNNAALTLKKQTGYTFYRTVKYAHCDLCELLNDIYVSENNPAINDLLNMLNDKCNIFPCRWTEDNLYACSKSLEDVEKGDALLKKIVNCSIDGWPTEPIYLPKGTPEKVYDLATIARHRIQNVACSYFGLPRECVAYKLIRVQRSKKHKCELCEALDGLIIRSDGYLLDQIIRLLKDNCKTSVWPLKQDDLDKILSEDGNEMKLEQDALTIRSLINKFS